MGKMAEQKGLKAISAKPDVQSRFLSAGKNSVLFSFSVKK